ncbi:hypothetical protein [Neisseria meningitidis]|nr:hypothetical protein [Neisseria meningitidis]
MLIHYIVIIGTDFKRGVIKMPSEICSDGIVFGKGNQCSANFR